ncbi:MAG: tetratricopeptide repeat protein [Acidobacteriota bacterium]
MRWIALVVVCLVAAAGARADDWGPHRDPFDPAVVRRYKAILARDPHDDGALRRLVALYQRYRTVATLETEYRTQLAGGDDWATLVVLARLPRPARADSLALWKRAVAARPDDALGWLAVGDASATDGAGARDAYLRAAKLVTTPARKKLALTKLVTAARVLGDHATVDAAYGELIALAPKDGQLWLDRGDAQVAAKRYAAALASFEAAEPLFATDPERRLTAMTSHAAALDALGRTDEALAEYEHTLDRAPAGYYLRQELVARLVNSERRRGQLADAIARLEKRWPERARGYFEWSTLADLYAETHDDERALAAYKRAVARAPTEVTAQRKLIALLDKLHPEQALAQHEAAARLAPGDADLQLALAKRYHPDRDDKAFAVLAALARRMSGNVGVRSAIAALYEQWEHTDRAIGEYEAIAALEPNDPDHAVVLGEAYWRINDQGRARAAWQRLDKIGTATALFRHGDVLALHEAWQEASDAYTRSLALDGANGDAWYGRARCREALGNIELAIDDARRAVALTSRATQDDGLRNRALLVRLLGRRYAAGKHDELVTALASWRFAFDRDDAAAGYLLAAHHARLGSHQLHDVLVKLHQLVPADDSLTMELARSFEHRHDYARAKQELAEIAKRRPARAEEIAGLIAQVDKDRERAELEMRWEEEGRSPSSSTAHPDLVGRDHRFGMRLELGGDVHGASAAQLGIGVYRTNRIAPGVAMNLRLDWTKRDSTMGEGDAFGLGIDVAARVYDARKYELSVIAGPRFELRYGYTNPRTNYDLAAVGGDLELQLLPRALPAAIGVRLDQALTDGSATALLVELGYEIR